MHTAVCGLLVLAACGRPLAPPPPPPPPPPAPAPATPPWSASSAEHLCDLPDRVILVDGKTLTVIARPSLTRTQGAITKTEHTGDSCAEGAHAGCSIHFHRFWSPVLAPDHLEIGSNVGNVIETDDGTHLESCRDWRSSEMTTCSTATRFVLVQDVQASLWEAGADKPAAFAVDSASGTDRWTLRFATHALVFDRAANAATLDGEPCIAFRLAAQP